MSTKPIPEKDSNRMHQMGFKCISPTLNSLGLGHTPNRESGGIMPRKKKKSVANGAAVVAIRFFRFSSLSPPTPFVNFTSHFATPFPSIL
jgi:hypothetical protein